MALICMAVYATEENQRLKFVQQTLGGLIQTVDFNKHRLFICDNSCNIDTAGWIADWAAFYFPNIDNIKIQINKENLGTSGAINLGIKTRMPNEHVIKMDDDCVVHYNGWVDEMEEAIERQPKIGVLGLKRKDLEQRPDHPTSFFKSTLVMLPHKNGERWIVVEQTADIMGTCTMLNYRLLDKIGYYKQPNQYGFDDSILNFRSGVAGFANCFLPHIHISHIDTGENKEYIIWKQQQAANGGEEYQSMLKGYKDGSISVYYNPYEDDIQDKERSV